MSEITAPSVAAERSTAHRLRKHADYQLVYNSGRKQFAKNIAYFYALRGVERRSDTTGPRIGLTVPKALGKAVDRNRIKRRMREAVRHNLGLLSAPLDVILHPRRVVMELEFTALEREVAVILRSIQAAFDRGLQPGGAPRPGPRRPKASATGKPVLSAKLAHGAKAASAP